MKKVVVSFCTESKPHLLDLTSKASRYQIPIAGRYRIIDWIISAAFNVEAERIILFEKFFPQELHEFLENYFIIGKLPDIKILPRSEGTIFRDFYNVVKNELADVFIIYNGDNPASAEFRKAIQLYEEQKVAAGVFRVFFGETSSEVFKVLIASKNILLHFLENLIKNSENAPVPFESLCNAMINEGMPEMKIQGYYKSLSSVMDYFQCNMDFIRYPKYFNNLYDSNPLGSYFTNGGTAKIARGSYVKNSLCAENVNIEGHVENSILFPDVVINRGAVVKDSIILANNIVGKKATLIRVVMDEATDSKASPHPNIGSGAEIGRNTINTMNSLFKEALFGGVTFVGKDCFIPRNLKIGSACYIKPQTDGNVFGKVDRVFDGQTV